MTVPSAVIRQSFLCILDVAGLGAIVVCLSKRNHNVVPLVLRMMKVLSHRGNDHFGISTTDELVTSIDLSNLESRNLDSPAAIGYNLMKLLPVDVPQPYRISSGTLALDGEIYSERGVTGVEELVRKTDGMFDLNSYADLVRSEDGAYAISSIVDDQIHLARDPLGLKPLYYGESEEFYADASERKALWSIGINSPRFFPPGNIATIRSNGLTLNPIRTLQEFSATAVSNGSIAVKIHDRLKNSIRVRTTDVVDVAVAFSGGLDSALVAFLTKSLGRNLTLISIGMKGSYDLVRAQKAAHDLNITLVSRTLEKEELEQSVRHALWCTEDKNPMKVEVAVAIGWAARVAAEEGYKVILTGQGADELFAGYAKFARISDLRGLEAAKEAATKSVVDAHMTNYTRDEQVSSPHRIRMRHPFAEWELTNLALSLPIEANLRMENDPLRKRVLRESAMFANMPRSIIEAPKRAVQYGSGIHKALTEIAKTRKLSVNQFIEKIYCELSWDRPPIS
jgi:asparagine synthase (glutamine-hydrolysing)